MELHIAWSTATSGEHGNSGIDVIKINKYNNLRMMIFLDAWIKEAGLRCSDYKKRHMVISEERGCLSKKTND